jgi:hypothetical protein
MSHNSLRCREFGGKQNAPNGSNIGVLRMTECNLKVLPDDRRHRGFIHLAHVVALVGSETPDQRCRQRGS